MDRQRKRELKRQWREGQRAESHAEFPLPIDELIAMFQMVEAELSWQKCDHTRRLAQGWLEEHGHDAKAVLDWLERYGGFCDCEILLNVVHHVEDAMHES